MHGSKNNSSIIELFFLTNADFEAELIKLIELEARKLAPTNYLINALRS